MREQISLDLNDRAATRYLANRKRMARLEDAALSAIDSWATQHGRPWVAISGGKDSTVLLHLVSQVRNDLPVVWYDSGLEYPQTRPFIESMCQRWGFDLHIIRAEPDALTLLEMSGHWEHGVIKIDHNLMDEALIDGPQREAMRRFGIHGIYGLRAAESASRFLVLRNASNGVIERHNRDGSLYHAFLAPLHRWRIDGQTDDINGYAAHHRIPMHPAYEKMTKLGVPAQHQRVGLLVSGMGLSAGGWARTYAVAPEYCRLVEQRLPILNQYR